jgi:hypothetical protein
MSVSAISPSDLAPVVKILPFDGSITLPPTGGNDNSAMPSPSVNPPTIPQIIPPGQVGGVGSAPVGSVPPTLPGPTIVYPGDAQSPMPSPVVDPPAVPPTTPPGQQNGGSSGSGDAVPPAVISGELKDPSLSFTATGDSLQAARSSAGLPDPLSLQGTAALPNLLDFIHASTIDWKLATPPTVAGDPAGTAGFSSAMIIALPALAHQLISGDSPPS